MSNQVYQIVTDTIINKLKNGIIPWQKPWDGDHRPIDYISKKPYSLLNSLMLDSGAYLTFHQIQQLGGTINKGCHSYIVVYFKMLEIDSENDPYDDPKKIPLLRYYRVFNTRDISGIDFDLPSDDINHNNQILNAPESVITNYFNHNQCKLRVDSNSNRAYFSTKYDEVVMPSINKFHSSEHYYATLFHEMTHSTGHTNRLNRDLSGAFGSKSYAKEELIAEMGSAMLCNLTGIDNSNTIDNSVAYIQGWLKELANDNQLIVYAAGKAEKAMNFIISDSDHKVTAA